MGEPVVVGVPIDCEGSDGAGAEPFGSELSPRTLRAAGLVPALRAEDGGDLDVRVIGRNRDPVTGVIGWPSVSGLTARVRARTGELASGGKVPVLVGGCCTLLPGALAGAREALGPVGLAYIDGHLDLYDGRTSPTGEAADMPIAVIAGAGPPAWCDQVGAPLVPPELLALLGPADREEAASLGSVLPEDLGIGPELTPAKLRAAGTGTAGQRARDRLARGGGRYWVHLDVDVLDRSEFPATDYPNPAGLTMAELADLLTPLARSPALAGFSLGCYNHDKDPGGPGARALVRLLGSVLR
jgi:arginase